MIHRSLALPLLATLASAALAAASTPPPPALEERTDFRAAFRAAGVEGTAVVYDEATGRWWVHDAERAAVAFLPASTFKLFNALVALETGAVADEHEVLRWSAAIPRPPGWESGRLPGSWTRDQSLASALQVSAVWFYQEVARRAGEERMRHWLTAAGYGNGDIGGGIDRFWLEGALRISALGQVDFLRRLADGKLPFSARAQEIVRRISIVRAEPDHALHAKSGWGRRAGPGGEVDLGWYVGWLERGGKRWFFALNLDLRDAADAPKRIALAEALLRRAGALP
jgi:beta-lactamase class D